MTGNTLKRQDVSDIVLDITRRLHFNPNLTEESQYDDIEITSDKGVKDLYYYALRRSLEHRGYTFTNFKPEDCVNAKTIRDVVDAVWGDVKNR